MIHLCSNCLWGILGVYMHCMRGMLVVSCWWSTGLSLGYVVVFFHCLFGLIFVFGGVGIGLFVYVVCIFRLVVISS
jgi:hypothetical protein